MFVVNVEKSARATIHEWPNDYPRFPNCKKQSAAPNGDRWERFVDGGGAQQFVSKSGLCVKLCRLCKPNI